MTASAVPCFNFQERLLPALRAETARRLSQKGMRQGRIAAHLGVSQAMVSKYLRRAPKPPQGVSQAALQSMAGAATQEALQHEKEGVLPPWCPLCPQLSPARATPSAADHELDECYRGDHVPPKAEADEILENLRQAERRIQQVALSRLAPQVRINLAMALASAKDSRGVAAFPGRLVEFKGDLRAVESPEFGASNHLADLLLRIRRIHPELRAILCLRDADETRRALRSAGLKFRLLKRVRKDLVVSYPRGEPVDAVIDPGDFGIEPITYLLAPTALAVVEKAERALSHLPPNSSPR